LIDNFTVNSVNVATFYGAALVVIAFFIRRKLPNKMMFVFFHTLFSLKW